MKNFILLSLFLISSLAIPTGFKTTITQSGLDELRQIGVEILEQKFGTIQLNSISGQVGTPIGHITYTLDNIELTNVKFPQSAVKTIAGTGLSLSLSDVSAQCNLDWSYRENSWPHISDHGTANIDMSGSSASATIQISDKNDRVYIETKSDSVNINNLQINLHGGASWLYSIFVNIFKGKIENGIDNALQNAISQNINKGLNQAIATLPVEVVLGNTGVELDYSLTGNPNFATGYAAFPLLGEFYDIKIHDVCNNCPIVSLPDTTDSEKIQLIIGEFVPDSAGHAFLESGLLNYNITQKQIPKYLNTSYFEYIIPALYQKYPNAAMMIEVLSNANPYANISTNGIFVKAPGELVAYVLPNEKNVIPVFTLGGSISTSGKAWLKNTNLLANLTYVKGDFKLIKSNVGTFSVSLVDYLLNDLFSNGIVPAINIVLQTGIPLPSVQGMDFINPTVKYGNGYLAVSTDFTYTPPN